MVLYRSPFETDYVGNWATIVAVGEVATFEVEPYFSG